MRILIHKEKASYEKFVKMPVVDSVRSDGYDILVVKENDNVGYYGTDYLFYYVDFDNDVDALAFKLKYL